MITKFLIYQQTHLNIKHHNIMSIQFMQNQTQFSFNVVQFEALRPSV
jgi:hypothetical protein